MIHYGPIMQTPRDCFNTEQIASECTRSNVSKGHPEYENCGPSIEQVGAFWQCLFFDSAYWDVLLDEEWLLSTHDALFKMSLTPVNNLLGK